MSGGGCSVVWFRRDLRVEDNPALAAGVRAGSVIALFVWAPEEEGYYCPGRVSRWWLKHSLAHLDSSLRRLGTSLVTKRSTDSVSSVLEAVKATGATQLFFNHLYGQFCILDPYDFVYFGIRVCYFNFLGLTLQAMCVLPVLSASDIVLSYLFCHSEFFIIHISKTF